MYPEFTMHCASLVARGKGIDAVHVPTPDDESGA
jgi:hypothetical protein